MPAMSNKKTEQGDIGQMFEKLAKGIGEPVDFELPDWLKKSDNYIVIRRNIYLTTQKVKKRVRVEDDGIFCSCSSTPGSSGVCGVDCHCGMLQSSCSSNCKCDQSCLNKPFHQRPMKKLKVVQTEKCGSGVVAEEDIMQGEFVIGICGRRRIDGETRIGIFATRDIKTGEHLTYDYQFVQFGADQDCHCGAVDCRRKLGVKPNKSNAALKIVACQVAINSSKVKAVLSGKDAYKNGVRQTGGSRQVTDQTRTSLCCIGKVLVIALPGPKSVFGIIKRFDVDSRKHLIMFEDGNSELLDLTQVDWELCLDKR